MRYKIRPYLDIYILTVYPCVRMCLYTHSSSHHPVKLSGSPFIKYWMFSISICLAPVLSLLCQKRKTVLSQHLPITSLSQQTIAQWDWNPNWPEPKQCWLSTKGSKELSNDVLCRNQFTLVHQQIGADMAVLQCTHKSTESLLVGEEWRDAGYL